jgi:hypothetical protein
MKVKKAYYLNNKIKENGLDQLDRYFSILTDISIRNSGILFI